jgi:lipopolysaccharide exporter
MWLTSWRVITRVIGVGSTLILARILVPADFGLIAMASTFAAAVDALSQLGLQDALVRWQGDNRALYDAAFTLQVGRALLTSIVLVAGAPTAAWWFNEPRLIPVLWVLAATSAVTGFENVGIVEFRRNMRFDVQFRLLLVSRLVQLATTIPLALALHSYWALLIGGVASKVTRTVMTYMVHPHRPRFGFSGWRYLVGFSLWTWATCAASLVWDRCDPFVLGPRLGPARLGLYFIAIEIAMLPATELIAPIADALLAGFAVAQKEGTSSLRHAPGVAAAMLLCLAPIIVTISCASGDIVAALLGPKWLAAQPVIAILTWQCLFSPFSWVCSVAMVANAKLKVNFVGQVIVSTVKLVVLVIAVTMTSRLDIIAAATAICVAIESAVYILLLKTVETVHLRDIAGSVLRTILATGVTVLVLAELGLGWKIVKAPPLTALFHGAIIGLTSLAVYVIADFAMWRMAGQPAGSEARLIAIVGQQLHYLPSRMMRWRKAA